MQLAFFFPYQRYFSLAGCSPAATTSYWRLTSDLFMEYPLFLEITRRQFFFGLRHTRK